MNILLISGFLHTKRRPTLASFVYEQAKALVCSGHQVTILHCDTYSVKHIREYANYAELKFEEKDGIKIYRKKSFCPLKHGIEGYRKSFAKNVLDLYKKCIEENQKPDIIHAHFCVWAGYAAMKLSEYTSIPYIITEHATLYQLHSEMISMRNEKYIKEAFQKAEKVICVSKAFAEVLKKYTDNTCVIGNIVDCDLFCPVDGCHVAEEQNGNKKTYTFLTICYMENEAQLRKKGLDILIKAWARVYRRNNNARLLVGGAGPAAEVVKNWARELNVPVTILGELSRTEVAEYMRHCDCFVLPSRYETFGVVYIEAMATGKPVIACKNGGPDDFVDEACGRLVLPEDIASLEEAMCAMIYNREMYQARQIRDRIKSRFAEEIIVAKLESLYSEYKNCKIQ